MATETMMELIQTAVSSPVIKDPVKSVTTTTRTTKTVVPEATDKETKSLMDEIDASIKQSKITEAQYTKDKGTSAELQNAAGAAVKEAATSEAVIKEYQNVAQMEAERTARKVADALGGTPENLLALAEKHKQLTDKALKEQEDVNKLVDETGLGGMIRRFLFLGGQVEEANVAEASAIKVGEAIQNITALATQVDQAEETLKSTVSEATIAASTRQLAALAAEKAATYEASAANSYAERAKAVLDFNNDQLNKRITKYNIMKQAVSEEQTNRVREMQLKQAEDEGRFADMVHKTVRAGRGRLAYPVADETDPIAMRDERDRILASLKLGGEDKVKLMKEYDIGARLTELTPAQLYSGLKKSNETLLTDGKNPSFSFLSDVADAATKTMGQDAIEGKIKKVTPEMRDDYYNKEAFARYEVMEKSIVSGDRKNPNHAPPLKALIEASPMLTELPLVKNVIKPLLGDKNKDPDLEVLVSTAAAAIKTKRNPEGTIELKEFVEGFKAIYSAAAAYNTESQGRMENDFPPPQTTYQAKFTSKVGISPTFFTFWENKKITIKDTVNMMDETELTYFVVKLLNAGFKGVRGEVFEPTSFLTPQSVNTK